MQYKAYKNVSEKLKNQLDLNWLTANEEAVQTVT